MEKIQHHTLFFEGFTLHLARGCLLRGVEEVKLRPKSFEVLRFLAQNDRRLVSKSELIEAIWPNIAVTDDSLVQCLVEIRKALGGSQIVKTVPRRGYIFEAEVIKRGVPDREFVYSEEIEAVTITLDEELLEEPAQTVEAKVPVRWLKRVTKHTAAAAILIASMIALAVFGFWPRSEPESRVESLAVLPFVNGSDDPQTDYLSDGITESLINKLSQLPHLRIKARSLVLQYKGTSVSPQQIGEVLGVGNLLMGTIIQRGDALVVQVDLVRAEDGVQIWGEQYNRGFADLLSVQEEIAGKIVERLRLRVSSVEKRQIASGDTANVEAYRLYLRGRHLLERENWDGLKKSAAYLREATALDPNYALAHAELGQAYMILNANGVLPSMEVIPKARAALTTALALDEGLSEAHAYMGNLAFAYDRDWRGAEVEFRRALEIDPDSALAHRMYAMFLAFMKRLDEALAESARAMELEPLSLIIHHESAVIHFMARRYDEAVELCMRAIELDPSSRPLYLWLARTYEQKGLYDQAVELELKYFTAPDSRAALKNTYARSGWKAFWQKKLDLAKRREIKTNPIPYMVALVCARVGEKDQALRWLEKNHEEQRVYFSTIINVDPIWDDYRSDPRFIDLLRRLGLPPV